MICEEAQYLHCSMQGSYYIPCVILAKGVVYDIQKYGTIGDRLHAAILGEEKHLYYKEVGYLISYQDIVTDEFVYGEWVPVEKVKRYE